MKVIISKVLSPFGLDVNQIYGFLDFILGFLLITTPWFYFNDTNVQVLAAVIISGAALILYSIFTDYKKGILKFLGQKIHNALDITVGVTLMALWPISFKPVNLVIIFAGFITLLGAFLI